MKTIQYILLFILTFLINSCTMKEEVLATHYDIDLSDAPGIPTLFAEGIISTSMNERDLAISPEANEIVFTEGNINGSRRALFHMLYEEEGWTPPEVLVFSGSYQDIEPFFSPDGTQLFFASTRPIGEDSSRTDYNIWYVERNESGSRYGPPQPVGLQINTIADEFYPSIGKSGNLYFTAAYSNGFGREDIYVARLVNGTYMKPEPLDSAINTVSYEFNAFVSPDEDLIIFSSYGREDDLGGGDLYISRKDQQGNWIPSKNLGESVNSGSLDYCPFIDFERNVFYFTSNRFPANQGKITHIDDLKNEYESVLNSLGNIYKMNLFNLVD